MRDNSRIPQNGARSSVLISRRVREFIWRHAHKIALAFVFMMIAGCATALRAWLMEPVLDRIFIARDSSLLWLLGGAAVIARSFARIHESNLKKQGLLPLAFAHAADYDKIRADDTVDLTGLTALAPGSVVVVVLEHSDGTRDEFAASHTLSDEHIAWFKAGSALNLLASRH